MVWRGLLAGADYVLICVRLQVGGRGRKAKTQWAGCCGLPTVVRYLELDFDYFAYSGLSYLPQFHRAWDGEGNGVLERAACCVVLR